MAHPDPTPGSTASPPEPGRLAAQALTQDPRVAQAKQLLLQVLAEHQARITSVRPPDPQLKQSYDQLIDRFGGLRGGPLYLPYLASGLGHGALVELADGSVKYDFITGIGVHGLGHSHPALVEAALDAAMSDTIMQGNLQQNTPSVDLTDTLVNAARQPGCSPAGSRLEHCLLTTSGAMANENALKMLFQFKHPAHRVLAFEGCFMGRTLALSQITDRPNYRVGLPATLRVDYLPFFDHDQPQASTQRALRVLRQHLARYPGQHAAMCFEMIQGEGGYYGGHHDFFVALMEELKTHGVPVMVDEIQTFGRTSELFAFQHYGLASYVDVVTIGKLSQACATLFTEAVKPKPGLISQTFTASTSAIHAARVILHHLLDGGYFGPDGQINQLHRYFVARLREIADRHPGAVRGPFGEGAMIAATVLDGSLETAKKLIHALYDAGVIAFIAGSQPVRVRFLIPVGAVQPRDIDEVCTILENTITQVAAATASAS